MTDEPAQIVWRLHLQTSRERVFELLTTDAGRAGFWAERTDQQGDDLVFHFPNGELLHSRILESVPPERFALSYFADSRVTFDLEEAGTGTDLTLTESGLPEAEIGENRAGWVSVLLNLKAWADHGVDLRNHDPERTWSDGYVDN